MTEAVKKAMLILEDWYTASEIGNRDLNDRLSTEDYIALVETVARAIEEGV